MVKNIDLSKAFIWNQRFETKMEELGLSQRKFIALYRAKFGTGSQADVSKWMHVGEVDGKTKKQRGFPAFETMRNIADILGVSVGYLIGETDYETFNLEHTSVYLGLSAKPIEAIRMITSGKAIPPFYKYPDPRRTAALELLLENSLLADFLKGVCELAEAKSKGKNPNVLFEKARNRIPKTYREDADALWLDAEQAIEKGVKPTDKLWDFVKSLDDAAYEDMFQAEEAEREINEAKYTLQEIYIKMIEELLSTENISKLLRYFTTSEGFTWKYSHLSLK